ncbi:hypothetical protein MPTK1_6g19400 [Marchantia polymorpha subsp. ruderalis]|uniref:Uncharacterized protein n=2 Tax=Marchantia polymorpha TaxID=3197 RepID=A0AAF6BTS6_MARPO|nr:hypothetical protein MARPO_0045s0123 [Marchantia polymorpha]PTQ39479.1 hypothetical protein MARPO_0045s0123 [Marchantia polymorpha]BBN15409.1 hypothetical protein Mp_6g19400 [Marchantia polymorpha subsp. ruderalis]BBN15410.1 hypothetical protein Mp_6g19400 [Marchantia polymorpha subsp. ruderalis]|eukprot:PTQ39478.1 hypothetical protein MARPO_0045s0123 [Marchantia polymorpha]
MTLYSTRHNTISAANDPSSTITAIGKRADNSTILMLVDWKLFVPIKIERLCRVLRILLFTHHLSTFLEMSHFMSPGHCISCRFR